MIIKTSWITALVIVSLFSLAFFQINFPFSNGRFDNDLPPHRMTVDPFIFQSSARMVYDSEDVVHVTGKNQVADLSGKVISDYPPTILLLITLIAKFTSAHIHQVAWIMVVFLTFLPTIGVFLIVRRVVNEKVALLTLPLGFFAEYIWFLRTYIGHWGDVVAFSFIPAAVFLLIYLHRKPNFTGAVILGFMITASIFGHFLEGVFIFLFVWAWTVLGFLFKKVKIDFFKYLIVSTIIVILFSAYFVPIMFAKRFKGGLSSMKSQFDRTRCRLSYYPQLKFSVFHFDIIVGKSEGDLAGIGILTLILTGTAILILTMQIINRKMKWDRITFLGFILFIFSIGLTCRFGFGGYRTFRQFYASYFLLVFLPAFGIYFIIYSLMKSVKLKNLVYPLVIVIILLLTLTSFPNTYKNFKAMASNQIVDETQWEAFTWINRNLPEDAVIYNLNGFIHSFPGYWLEQRTIMSTENVDSLLLNIQLLCNLTYPYRFTAWCASWEGRTEHIVERTGLFSFRLENISFCREYPRVDIPGFNRPASLIPLNYTDYVLIQYKNTGRFVGQNYDPCMAFFINKSVEKGHSIVWHNDKMMIFKVNKEGV